MKIMIKIIYLETFLFDPEKGHYQSKKSVDAFNNNYVEYESVGEKDKTLTIKDYLDMIRPYLSSKQMEKSVEKNN